MKDKKPTFFTSDWHIGHQNVIEFDNRPFNSLEQMHQYLIRQYNSQVPDNGICYFLGDMGLTSSETLKNVITQLKGIKVLILGNHDKKMNAMYTCGFDAVMYGAVLFIQNEKVTLSHCPLIGEFREDLSHLPEHKQKTPPENWHGELDKGYKYSFKNEGQFHLHGHIHARKDTPHKVISTDNQFDVGVAAHNYRPVSISTIESWIMKHRNKG